MRREAWYGRWAAEEACKAVLGEGGCEMVGEDVIMSGCCEDVRVAGSGRLGRRKLTVSGNWRAHHSRSPGQPDRSGGRNVEKRSALGREKEA